MKKPGIIGGISPEATGEYYQSIIKSYREAHQDDSYPELIVNSINMTKMIAYLEENNREDLTKYLTAATNATAKAGADFAAFASNTPHIVFEEVAKNAVIPLISIVNETSKAAAEKGLKKVGLFGTTFTMSNDFYQKRFTEDSIEIIVPNTEEQEYIHRAIFSELVFGTVNKETKKQYIAIINRMKADSGIQGLILGCTELPLLIQPEDVPDITVLNTTQIHIDSIVKEALT